MQTRKGSVFEVTCNYVSGFIVAALTWQWVVVPMFNCGMDYSQVRNNLVITTIFTVISVLRSYFWRRLFNWLEYKGIVK